ncbi:MAG: FAD-dependent oxidoreductase [Chloroflexota bacterium]|nr:MAG: FAD-dependent oxidoreductase [Chloroflexota bacterium]
MDAFHQNDPAGPGFWLSRAPDSLEPALRGDRRTDVAIVGGGFTGLWTAIQLLDADPELRVTILEMERVGFGASGRNGGFCDASLTHGLANGIAHFPSEIRELEAEGRRNLAELVAFVAAEGIACDLEQTGSMSVADQPHQVEELRASAALAQEYGVSTTFLDRAAVWEELHSPVFEAGLLAGPDQTVMLDPARLARGLKQAALRRGATIHERTRVTGLERRAGSVHILTDAGARLVAQHVVVATSAYSGWLGRLQRLFVPVYDYVLVSDPMTTEQLDSIGWRRRMGVSDSGNQFHYFRLTADNRILWGGYDAIYHSGNRVSPALDERPTTFERLEQHFVRAFPQLADLRFPWRWGGAIDTTSRFMVTIGQSMAGRLTYALGYTGLGVGAARWAGGVVRDMILDPTADRLQLEIVRSGPFPFPPEPARWLAVEAVRRELARADANEGRRGLLLRTLDAIGIGFDS